VSRKKKIKPCLGDVFTFKLENGFNCFGQIVAPCPKDVWDMLYILYDFASVDQPYVSEIVKKPILAIANLVPGDIEDGTWTIIGNDEIPASSIVLPNYVITNQSKGGTVVLRYDGTFVRSSTIEEQMLAADNKIPNLRTWSTRTGGFESIAKYRFDDGEWNEFDQEMLFEGSMWDAMANQDGMPLHDFLAKPSITTNRYEHDQYHAVTIQYDLAAGGFGTKDDLDRRHRIEDLLRENLRATNNGDCDGGEIGNGEMIIFCNLPEL
jgi:hypothetical protein